jgi:hypothetical protein
MGDDREAVEGTANQLRGSRCPDRWVFTVGKFGVTDIFDTNQYAHDPRADFLNWSAVDAGSFDYAADAWGFTVGAAAERYPAGLKLSVGTIVDARIISAPSWSQMKDRPHDPQRHQPLEIDPCAVPKSHGAPP